MNYKYDIHLRIYKFVLRGLKLLGSIPKNTINIIIIDQCGWSLTSVGANDQEADACESRRDFIAKYSIVKKEANESVYWFSLIGDLNTDFYKEAVEVQKEGKEIFLIVSSIIKNAKKKGYLLKPIINNKTINTNEQ